MLRPLAMVGVALSAACAGAAPGVFTTTRALGLGGDEPTEYVPTAADVAAEAEAAEHAATVAAIAPSAPAIAAVLRRAAEPGATGSVLVLRRGADTLAVEYVVPDGRTQRSSLALRGGRTVDYRLTARADGSIERFEASVTPSGADAATERFWARFSGDSIHSRTVRVDRPTIFGGDRVPRGVVTYINPSPLHMEQIVRRARSSTRGVAELPVLVFGEPSVVMPATVAFVGRDSAVVTFGDIVARLAIDADGRVLGGEIPASALVIERREVGVDPVARRD